MKADIKVRINKLADAIHANKPLAKIASMIIELKQSNLSNTEIAACLGFNSENPISQYLIVHNHPHLQPYSAMVGENRNAIDRLLPFSEDERRTLAAHFSNTGEPYSQYGLGKLLLAKKSGIEIKSQNIGLLLSTSLEDIKKQKPTQSRQKTIRKISKSELEKLYAQDDEHDEEVPGSTQSRHKKLQSSLRGISDQRSTNKSALSLNAQYAKDSALDEFVPAIAPIHKIETVHHVQVRVKERRIKEILKLLGHDPSKIDSSELIITFTRAIAGSI